MEVKSRGAGAPLKDPGMKNKRGYNIALSDAAVRRLNSAAHEKNVPRNEIVEAMSELMVEDPALAQRIMDRAVNNYAHSLSAKRGK